MNQDRSILQRHRAGYVPKGPELLLARPGNLRVVEGEAPACPDPDISGQFPHSSGKPVLTFRDGVEPVSTAALRVGVVLSGGQAPGGHNVIAGLLDGLLAAHPDSKLFGFLAGPGGILRGETVELTPEVVEPYRNTGGFDIIGSGRDKIEGDQQLQAAMNSCAELKLDGLVVIGGDDSNTNAAVMAEYFLAHGSRTSVIGVPKTIDGDLMNDWVEQSFGFDTATKVYSELIGNICRDAHSAKKYWHFIKLMGRSASHVTLECAMQIRPDVTLIGEEVEAKGMTLRQVAGTVVDAVIRRAEAGRNYGVCLVPEGLIEFIPEVGVLIRRLNDLLAKHDADKVVGMLPADSAEVFKELPEGIARQLLIDRDSHGNVQVSRIDTEKLLLELAAEQVKGKVKFSSQAHFFGYEGRCSAPSNFDADYTACLGRIAAVLLANGRTGYMCGVRQLSDPATDWEPCAVPVTALLHTETRHGERKPVIEKALVDLDGPVFQAFARQRESWVLGDCYLFPGPIQFFGPAEVVDRSTATLQLRSV
ncbi:MAG: diphosphate--fructose-6-phosphate 1-phosphotransferase [Acidobacteria bacterium]|uniref:Pyrophosphate--fructose 6-phosphate 1-phosphotransferase n=1 Tax=Candidatus Polarisedimenticola svalbardensis TaxID=2886004 RepID=A0A8J7C1F2_9BACT|nr:diphosphate--fructose-6-phosphate 1-phosphotransferase [Candidatus Polarisedimenticola svalbardensis]